MSYSITALSLPVVALPTAILLRWRSNSPQAARPDLKPLAWTYILSGTVGVAAVSIVQTLIGYVFGIIIFGSTFDEYMEEFGRKNVATITENERRRRAEMAWTWQYFTMILIFAFILAGSLEEIVKYVAITINRGRGGKLKPIEYIGFALASSLGFSTIENIGFVYVSTEAESVGMIAVTLIERLVLGSTGHCLMAALTACNMIASDVHGACMTPWQILYPAILYHGMFDFAIFGISALDGNVGWIHPTKASSVLLLFVLAVSMLVTLATHVRGRLTHITWT